MIPVGDTGFLIGLFILRELFSKYVVLHLLNAFSIRELLRGNHGSSHLFNLLILGRLVNFFRGPSSLDTLELCTLLQRNHREVALVVVGLVDDVIGLERGPPNAINLVFMLFEHSENGLALLRNILTCFDLFNAPHNYRLILRGGSQQRTLAVNTNLADPVSVAALPQGLKAVARGSVPKFYCLIARA